MVFSNTITTMACCKRCTCTNAIIKNGKVRNQQRYYCKSCQYNFVPGDRRKETGHSEAVKALAVLLYGTMKSSYGVIARLLETSRKTVYLWIKKAGHAPPEPSISETITAIEFDEMWHFIQSKKQTVDLESIRSLFQKVHRSGGGSQRR